jgi:hypothetical protein
MSPRLKLAGMAAILICGVLMAAKPGCAASAQSADASGVQVQTQAPSHHRFANAHIRERVKQFKARVSLLKERIFERARSSFAGFCQDWQSKLKARERNNITHIAWKRFGDKETGTYVGYGDVQSCTCKQTGKGIPIGKLGYREYEYELDGKTPDEATHAHPKPLSITNTTEIFRWDDKLGKWIY